MPALLSPTIYTETLPGGYTFDMRLVPAGTFDMGSPEEVKLPYTLRGKEENKITATIRKLTGGLLDFGGKKKEDYEMDLANSEKPQRISVSMATFYIAPFLVTQQLWQQVMGPDHNLAYYKEKNLPIEFISWLDTQEFIEKLNALTNEQRRVQGLGAYRLLTEAEWEYAARGGPLNARYAYAGSDKLKEVGWFNENSGNETHEVGKRLPNALALYDMSGNVWEWVEDHWHNNYENAPKDGRAWLTEDDSAQRVLRGGWFFRGAQNCRVACRYDDAPDYRGGSFGFRLAMSPSLGQPTPAIL